MCRLLVEPNCPVHWVKDNLTANVLEDFSRPYAQVQTIFKEMRRGRVEGHGRGVVRSGKEPPVPISDGKSAYERLKRRQHQGVLLPFGTAVMCRVAGKVPGGYVVLFGRFGLFRTISKVKTYF